MALAFVPALSSYAWTVNVDDLFEGSGGQGGAGLGGQGGSGAGGPGPSTSVTSTSSQATSTSVTSTSSVATSTSTSSTSTSTSSQASTSSGGPVCGNNVQESPEECDGVDLDGASCTDLGYTNPAGVVCVQCALDYEGCAPTCGNGVVEPGEGCDDGNLIGGDGCSSSCQPVGVTCAGAIPVMLTLGETILSGSTVGGANTHAPPMSNGCPDGSGPERLYAVTPTQNAFLTAWIPNATSDFDSVLYARTACADQASQIQCDDNYGTPGNSGGEVLSFPVLAGQTYFVFVDGFSGDAGSYDLVLDLSVGDDCNDPVPITIEGQGTIVGRGSTTGYTSNVTCSNGAGVGPDVVYAVKVTDADNYNFNVTAGYNSVLNIRSACSDFLSQLGCSSPQGNNSGINDLSLNAQQTVYVWVDGTTGQSGSYSLAISH